MDSNTQSRISSLGSQAFQANCRITDLKRELARQKERLANTVEASRLHKWASEQFGLDNQANYVSASELAALSNVKLAQRYSAWLYGLLEGTSAEHSKESVLVIDSELDNETATLEQKVLSLKSEIARLEGQVSSLNSQINILAAGA